MMFPKKARGKKTSKQRLKNRLDLLFSEYIRTRDADKGCVTCGGYGTKDCGHFISRRFLYARWDERNAHGQCLKCNRFLHGEQYRHGLAIDRMYGEGTAELLEKLSKITLKPTFEWYEEKISYFKGLLNE